MEDVRDRLWCQARACKNLPFNLTEYPFCPAAKMELRVWKTVSLFSCCTHTTSYPTRRPLNYSTVFYLWGKQALFRAAPVWSIIKYNATWKCIRHETWVWTSHSDFLLVIHFLPVHMLTAAVFIFEYLFYMLFQPFLAHRSAFFLLFPLLGYSLSKRSWVFALSSWHLEDNKIMSCLIVLLLSCCSLSTQYYTQ